MVYLLRLSFYLDRIITFFGVLGSWSVLLLICSVFFDVVTRYAGIEKPYGLNSTKLQESQYWLHTVLFSLTIGYAFIRQSHVRITLIHDALPLKVKVLIELIGTSMFLLSYSILGSWFTYGYVYDSFMIDEVSRSVVGLPNIWVLKSFILIMFVLMGASAVSQFIKALAIFVNAIPKEHGEKYFEGRL